VGAPCVIAGEEAVDRYDRLLSLDLLSLVLSFNKERWIDKASIHLTGWYLHSLCLPFYLAVLLFGD
jgi:hypothetical protein